MTDFHADFDTYSQYFSTWPFKNDKDSQFDFDRYSQYFCTWSFKNDKDFQVEFGTLLHLLIAVNIFLLGSLKTTKTPNLTLINTDNFFVLVL